MNVKANALSRRYSLIIILEIKLLGLECLKKLYASDVEFGKAFALCANLANVVAIRELLVNEANEDELIGQFGELKTYKNDIHHICERYIVCRMDKSESSPYSLYTPLPIPTSPWVDIDRAFFRHLIVFKDGQFYPCYKKESKFLRHFCWTLWIKLDTKLLFSTTCDP
ncbi:hypothetical protein CR513_39080, partial [Mucuna pruriens]